MHVQDELAEHAYQFFMRVDPGMRDFLGPIEIIDDPVTGREMRTRKILVSTVRGMKRENMKETTAYLDPLPHLRQEQGKDLQGWYQSKHDTPVGGRPRPCMTDAILTQPYGGYCAVGCGFCYINAGPRGYRGSGLATVPLNYGEHVKRQLASMQVSTAGYFSSFTDPFLPLEDYYHNTEQGVRAFLAEGLPIFFLSRRLYPGWAFDALTLNKYSYAQKSINTCDEDDWKKLSPGAASLKQHLDQIRDLHKRGIYVSIQCNPVMGGITSHEDIEQLFEMLARAGTDHVIVKFVEADFPWAQAMVDRVVKAFGDNRGALFRELFTENSCGAQRTIQEDYRREGHERYRKKATKLGMTYSLCYEYTRKPDGVWKSMGPEFLTADQCHGHRVPMHVRGGKRFKPLAVCPPSGCLTCADTNDDEPRCGSELLGSAKALRLKDLRTNPGVTV